ncbi:MAG: MBL fold metallo-hydrolase [Collimonas sp.]|uniref:MBL fold metallo-hydrolase n=1 Tax=Collimonas sp. TaxID=1963772 RepID=UPI003262E754
MSAPSLPSTMRVLERGWLSSNNILFLGSGQTALVDSGYVTHAPQTLALVAHGLQGRPLDRLLNTHLHSDHCGGNAALQQAYACRTSIPAGQAGQVQDWDGDALTYNGTGQQCAPFSFDDTLQAGDLLTLGDLEWQVLAAAGHDPHSLIFYCPEQAILISADALWESGFGVIFPELDGDSGSGFAEAQATLELIAKLDVRLVIPGHGSPFTGVAAALDTAFSRLAYLAADPQRNARNAIKVLLKFLLLERQRIRLADVAQLLSGLPLVAAANRLYLQSSEAELAEWTVAQLVRAGAAEVRDGYLLNSQ